MTPEEAVVGACLLDPSVIREAVQHVMPSDFATWQGEETFQAIVDVHSMGQPVDVLTVSARLLSKGSKVNIATLHEVMAMVPTASNVGFYAAAVRESSVRRGIRVAASRMVQASEDETIPAAVTLARGMDELKSVRDDAPVHGVAGRSLGEVMAEPDSWDWVIRGLLERRDRFVLTGGEGAGKSMLVRQMAILASAGIHPFYLGQIDPVDVVVIDRENTEGQWRRAVRGIFEAARRNGTMSPARLHLSCEPKPMDITRDSDLGRIHRTLDENPCDLLFIGPLYRLVPRAINTDDDAAPVLAALDSLRERGVAMVMEAHAGHQRERDLRPRGSAALLGWPEFGRGLRKDPTIVGLVHLEQWRGDREPRSFPDKLVRGGPVPWMPPDMPEVVLAPFRAGYQSVMDTSQESQIGF